MPLDPRQFPGLTAGHFLHRPEVREELLGRIHEIKPRARRHLDLIRSKPQVRIHELTGDELPPWQVQQVAWHRQVQQDLLEAIMAFDDAQLDDAQQPRILSIVQDYVRPSFVLTGNRPDYTAGPGLLPETLTYWKNLITTHEAMLTQVFQSVGRIDLQHHETKQWSGTGWLVRPDVVVTNRHVAEDFQQSDGSGWRFRQNVRGQPITASLNHAEDPDRMPGEERRLTAILHIEPSGGPDLALLRVEPDPLGGSTPAIPLAGADAHQAGLEVLAVGYPRYDSSAPEPADMVLRSFGNRFNVKRAAPGTIMPLQMKEYHFAHDCSTLNRSSGSVVVDLATGRAVGLHMGGKLLRENYAVTAGFLQERLHALNL